MNKKFRVWSNEKNAWLHSIVLGHSGDLLLLYVEVDDNNIVTNKVFTIDALKPTLQMFTGLKDKNGMDIYEGDILDSTLQGIGCKWVNEVVFENGCFVFGKGGYPLKNYITETSGFRIIGNIFENKDLLK
jgi:uncharacterized phage protein (TIGR01671 family)